MSKEFLGMKEILKSTIVVGVKNTHCGGSVYAAFYVLGSVLALTTA